MSCVVLNIIEDKVLIVRKIVLPRQSAKIPLKAITAQLHGLKVTNNLVNWLINDREMERKYLD